MHKVHAVDFQYALNSMVPLTTIDDKDVDKRTWSTATCSAATLQSLRALRLNIRGTGTNAQAMSRSAHTSRHPVQPIAQAPQIINEQGLADASRTCGLI
ncbi:hypothetical protein MHAE_12663 [Mycobacterium haemophilum DSM 44634]|uniref:hypothetical protein n=1 Tax=Mycobacterium haemophilum TaxID=29311 RepID=UPI0006D5B9E9|nr:hypothetical protein [Mycobacterium haemophilum]MCV7342597.1 hypothetical protein [Mycobacterium haemophilum DSM 44634]